MFDSTPHAGRACSRRVLSLLAVPLLLTAAACTAPAAFYRPTPQRARDDASAKPTRAYVVNKSFNDLRIYFVRNGSRTPLGWVQGFGSEVLEVPEPVIGTGDGVQLIAGLPGGGVAQCATQILEIMPGSQIYWVILEKHTMTTARVDW